MTFSTRPGALSASRRISNPRPDRRIPRLSPAFCRTPRPGLSRLPFADRVTGFGPTAGGFRLSGFGKELGREALDAYLQTKTVWVDLP